MPGFNDVAWFEIGAADPAAAERFYGDVFGWKTAQDESASTDPAYRVIDTGGSRGGLATGTEDYAIFTVLVEDVEAACERAEAAGEGALPQVRAALLAAMAEIEAYLARRRSQASNS